MSDPIKPSWYFIRNSSGKYDGAWTLAIASFAFIVFVTLVALLSWVGLWIYYYGAISRAEVKMVAAIKAPGFKFSDIAAWVASFGGMVLAPTIAAYVARKNDIGKTYPPVELLDRTPVTTDDRH